MLSVKLCELYKQQGQSCCGRVEGTVLALSKGCTTTPSPALGGAVAMLVKLLVPRAAPTVPGHSWMSLAAGHIPVLLLAPGSAVRALLGGVMAKLLLEGLM